MAERWLRGRLRDTAAAPHAGEDVERLLDLHGVVVEHILSGTLGSRVDYRQEHDEWVVLLAGGATLVVDGEPVELNAGDWLFLPALVEHTLVTTAPGSSWLAVHVSR
jgi:cupin 2 domain-containing protein